LCNKKYYCASKYDKLQKGVKIQKPPASLALKEESNFNTFKNLFWRISGPKGKEILH
jgi:hypothetical protein